MIKVLCLDYDNTVFDHRLGNIPESAREALEAVRGKCRLVLASGRFFNDAWNAPIKELVKPDVYKRQGVTRPKTRYFSAAASRLLSVFSVEAST